MIVGGINRAALDRFNEARLTTQYRLYGQPVTYLPPNGATPVQLLACLSAIRNNKQLRDGGFALLHDFIAKIRVREFPTCPKEEAQIQVGAVVYRIKEVIKHPVSGEWKMGLCSST